MLLSWLANFYLKVCKQNIIDVQFFIYQGPEFVQLEILSLLINEINALKSAVTEIDKVHLIINPIHVISVSL